MRLSHLETVAWHPDFFAGPDYAPSSSLPMIDVYLTHASFSPLPLLLAFAAVEQVISND